MMRLTKGDNQGLRVGPRWPSSKVLMEREVFLQLVEVQSRLPRSVQLLVTRGYENRSSYLGFFRSLSRWLGIKLFCLCYPQRKHELEDIFGSNGHDVDGSHVDVSIVLNGKRLRFLPLGVFTSLVCQERLKARYSAVVDEVKETLRQCGFEIHRNHTESLQIHCDYKA
ncbi:hypothetical protein GV819_17065 [Pseudomonas sp. Fl5BN2]|uniref:hypothetical protein n=1 Tax=unclassified Pseudomonas TaxID=196821 RepID=UPI0013788C7E|nr:MULTISPECIES: hypothetical protein [unclassified Pseudomonas]NBF03999.1 hypothetical protein [Pseudomonas sp. Fl5BN2]NBF09755.1 hypothetical protein [Pseudomonas sp. Fl4BN1]